MEQADALGRERYLKRLGELSTNVFKVEAITNRVRELEARLKPVLEEVDSGYLAHHLLSRVARRLERGR